MSRGRVVWITGHSKSGKTSLARTLAEQLRNEGIKTFLLDSDTIPVSIIKPQAESWQKSQELKNENIMFLSKLLYENGYLVIIASVGRFRYWRDSLRRQIPDYLEIYLKCALEVRLQRDTSNKYGSHPDYFHIYEEPLDPHLAIETDRMTIDESLQAIRQLLQECGYTAH